MHSKVKDYCELTLRVLFRIMHGEEQREGGADRLFATATQAAVLHFTSEQFTDCRLARGTQRTVITDTTKTNEWWHLHWTCFCTNSGSSLTPYSVLGKSQSFFSGKKKHLLLHWYLFLLALTCCWLPCRPVGPPAPVSPGAAGWGWSGSSFGLSDRVWLSLFARQSLRGSDPALKLLGWYETLGGSYWPWVEEIGEVGFGLFRLWQGSIYFI